MKLKGLLRAVRISSKQHTALRVVTHLPQSTEFKPKVKGNVNKLWNSEIMLYWHNQAKMFIS